MPAEEQINEEAKPVEKENGRWQVVDYFGPSVQRGEEIAKIMETIWRTSNTLYEFLNRAKTEISGFSTEPERNLAYFMIGRKVEIIKRYTTLEK